MLYISLTVGGSEMSKHEIVEAAGLLADPRKELVSKYPELFEGEFCLEVGIGWLKILDALFEVCVEKYRSSVAAYNACSDKEYVSLYRQEMECAKDALPKFKQIKEKFGGLRIYATTVNQEDRNYIKFAERFASHVCDCCGSVGTLKNSGGVWLTRCQSCIPKEETHFHG